MMIIHVNFFNVCMALLSYKYIRKCFVTGTPTFLPALANLYGDKSAIMVLSGSGGKKGKKSGSTSASKVDITHGGEKVHTVLPEIFRAHYFQIFWKSQDFSENN